MARGKAISAAKTPTKPPAEQALVDLTPPPDAPVCEAHKTHRPTPLTHEAHHVIPQAWQIAWSSPLSETPPPPDRSPSPDRPGVMLWDARTVLLCPTGHRNVHHWIVKMMHAVAGQETADPDAAAHAVLKAARDEGVKPAMGEFAIASQALARFRDAGGDLHLLTTVGQFGIA